METEAETLTHRYERIIGALLTGIAKHKHVLPAWLFPVFDKMFKNTYMRGLDLLCKLMAGTYRQPRQRTTKRKPSPPKPPVFIPPDQPPTTGWMWLSLVFPAVFAPALATARVDLQQLLSEPGMGRLFEAAPALRRHLRPLCRALGVTLPGDPAPPPDPPPLPPLPPRYLEPIRPVDTPERPRWVHRPFMLREKNAF